MTHSLGFARPFTSPFFTGTGTAADVPGLFDVGIDGYGYMLDRDVMPESPLISSIRATRAQSDGSQEPGEQSLNVEDLWRRSQQSWHLGAGQDYLDRDDSERSRFRSSKGINPWAKGQVSLLNATAEALNCTGTNLRTVTAGSRLYVVDGTALKFTTDLTNWTTVTGTTGASISGIASDGFNVWVTDGADVYKTDTGVSTAASWSTEDLDSVWYVKGRLLGADGSDLMYASSISVPTFTSLFAHNVATFTWVGAAEAPGHIIVGGYSGDKSLIYRVTIAAEGTNLAAPTVAGELPDGEILYAVGSYLGYIFLGTSEGARFCTVDSTGALTIGALIPTDYPVRCFEGQGEFVWFGWTNYDGTSSGLGRISLRTFSDAESLKLAYASDLMVTSTANILDVCTFSGVRVFAVSGDGIYKEDTANLVASGTLNAGRLNFGISEQKIPLYVDVTYLDHAGTTATYYATNGSTDFNLAGTHATSASDDTFPLSQDSADQVEIRHVLTRGSPTTTGPTVLRTTVRAQPVPLLRRRIVLPVVLQEKVETNARTWAHYDVSEHLAQFELWRRDKSVVTVQVGSESYATILDDFDFVASHPTALRGFWQGTCIAQFKTV